MNKKPSFEAAVGFFVVIGFLILSMFVFFISGVYFFRPGYNLSAIFDYVGIINKGAPVRFNGVRVGEVSKVSLLKPEGEQGKAKVKIAFFVEKGVEVRENYTVAIEGTHIMSEPHIEIKPVPGNARVLQNGDVILNGISPFSMDDLIKQGQAIAERLNTILEATGGMFDDPETRARLQESFNYMHDLLGSMSTVMVGHEQQFREMLVHLNQVADETNILLERINKGEGSAGKFFHDDGLYNDMHDFVREIKTHPWKLFKKG